MKFAIHILPTYMPEAEGALPDFYQQMYDQIVEVERLGFEQAWVTEHHFGGYGGTLPHPPTFIAAVAGKTTKIRLGVAVAVLPLHNPLQLAEAYAMADVISGGRLDFGIGKGSEPVEYRKFGMNRDEATQRSVECTEIIRQAWSDGPVNFRGEFYHYEGDEWKPIPGSLEAIARLNQAGYTVVIATNQSGIGRGLFDMATLNAIHDKMHRTLGQAGGRVDGIFYCPHAQDAGCSCRKPRPGLLDEIARRFGVSLEGVPVIGDSLRDLQAAAAVGAQPVLVLTGKGKKTRKDGDLPDGTVVHANLAEAVHSLLQ